MFIRPELIFEEKVKIHVLTRAHAGPGPSEGPENQDMRIRSNMTSGDVLDALE